MLAALALAGCTIEVGPPPESDPPLVPEAAKAPPPPPQPTEPQAWSRDLDLDKDPTGIDRRQLAEGLVASDAQGQYSSQRLTFQSAFEEEQKISEAELMRRKARERAEAAGLPPPPEVSTAPVAEVSAQSLDEPGTATPAKRQSRLPPPPKFPPLPSEAAAAETAEAAPEGAAVDGAAAVAAVPQQPWEQRQSRLPPPPKFPPLPQENLAPETASGPVEAALEPAPEAAPEPVPEAAPGSTQLASADGGGSASQPQEPAAAGTATENLQMTAAAPAEAPDEAAVAEAESFTAAAWDAPSGTILVQVSAVPDAAKVTTEWQRLQDRFPEVLRPLRLVVEQATLGERTAFYRVQAGGFGSQEGAAAACDVLISAGQSCFVMVR